MRLLDQEATWRTPLKTAFKLSVPTVLEPRDTRVGALSSGALSGEPSVIRTPRNERDGADRSGVALSAFETHADLRATGGSVSAPAAAFDGGRLRVTDPVDAGITKVRDHVRFRFDDQSAADVRVQRATGDRTTLLRTRELIA